MAAPCAASARAPSAARRRGRPVGAVLPMVLALGLWLAALGRDGFEDWIEATDLPPLAPAVSAVVLDREGRLLRAFTVADGRWRLPVEPGDVDPLYLKMLLAWEDRRFYAHRGVDPRALLRAAWQMATSGRIVSGGSTLTMQLARLLTRQGGAAGPDRGRWARKLGQIRLALALERRLSKRQILRLYLMLAPFGGNLEGVRAAALAWFGREPGRLTPAQAALLVALPQAPERRRPDRFPAAARKARDRVLARMAARGVLTPAAARAAMAEPVPATRRPFPALAAQLTARLVTGTPAPVLRLTLDAALQARLERLAAEHVGALPRGLSAAILVVDHRSGAVLAHVGGAQAFADAGGFLDLTQALRSPGSVLKPLIYGLAFEAGLAHPETLIADRPMRFGDYAPGNFDGRFRGLVPVRVALRESLNIPAVALLKAVGPARLLARMRRAGARPVLPAGGPPGLAIALGGIGVTLEDLVRIQGAIARLGRPLPLHLRADARPDPAPSRPVLAPEAAWQVARILTGVPPGDSGARGRLAVKTGTSYGSRDAWAIGFDGAHVIGVWIGRPDGTAVPGILGAETAIPLLTEAFAVLKPRLDPLPPPPPRTRLAGRDALPPSLRVFRRPGAGPADQGAPAPEIAFPPDGARVELARDGDAPLPLVVRLQGGTPPFTWLVNGVPAAIGVSGREAALPLRGPGFFELAVIDGTGRAGRVRIQLR